MTMLTRILLFTSILALGACVSEAEFPNADLDNLPDPGPEGEPDPMPGMEPDPMPGMMEPDPMPGMMEPDPMPDAPPSPFDRQIFIDSVSPPISLKCSAPNTCHGGPNSAFGQGFTFFANGMDGQIDDNITAVAAFINLDDPGASEILSRSRDGHKNITLEDAEFCAIHDWIYTGIPDTEAPLCTPP